MEPRTYIEFVTSIVDTLESLDIQYAIGGSFASNAYGEARTTVDMDISIVLPESDVRGFIDAMQQLGYYVSLDAIVDAMLHNTPFNVIDAISGYKADLYIVQPTPLERSVLARCRRVVYNPKTYATAMLYSPEDVILYKLKYYVAGRSQKHLRDIAAILVVQGAALDYKYIAHWAEETDTTEVWEQLLDEYRRRSS